VRRAHGERGQVLPLWIVAILTTFTLMFLAINYGNTVRWQMRAQNAADAAAQALVAVQTQRWNELTMALYTANVEEFRIRFLLDGMLYSLDGAGGCSGLPAYQAKYTTLKPFAQGAGTCSQTFQDLLPYYEKAVSRYNSEVALVNNISSGATSTSWKTDVTNLLAHLSSSTHCNNVTSTTFNVDGGDCAMTYTLNYAGTRGNLQSVSQDALEQWVSDGAGGYVPAPDNQPENPVLFDPAMVDVVTCAKVPPLIPSFGPLHAATHYVIGRAGATAVQFEEDWMSPGILADPIRPGVTFQPDEHYSATAADLGYGHDWYGFHLSGNEYTVGSVNQNGHTYYGYAATLQVSELSAFTAFWSAIPYDMRNAPGINNIITPTGVGPSGSTYCPP
jgi:hypothetical protein